MIEEWNDAYQDSFQNELGWSFQTNWSQENVIKLILSNEGLSWTELGWVVSSS